MEIEKFVEKYNSEFNIAIQLIETSNLSGSSLKFFEGIDQSVNILTNIQNKKQKVYIVGNGGSAAIASHVAIDFLKNGNISAMAFNDASLLTCISNDIGFGDVFAKPIEIHSKEGDLVICISSSGESVNIINAAKTAKEKDCFLITLSGFDPKNKLRALGDVNFFVPSFSYGFAEIIHQFILHSILDAKMYCYDGKDVFNKNTNIEK